MRLKTFLDMDGVLIDFVGGCCKLFGKPWPYENLKSQGIWEIEKLFGIDRFEFAHTIRNTKDFWANLEPTKEAYMILDLVERNLDPWMANTVILTAPMSGDPNCVLGKTLCVESRFPKLKGKIIFADSNAKKYMSGPGRLLIDDKDENVNEWNKERGFGILLPRPWNVDWEQADDPMKTLRREFAQFEDLYI